MIVQVAGKDSARVQQILRAGTIVFHSFRYWWPALRPRRRRARRNPRQVSRRRPLAPLPRRRLRRSNSRIQRLAPAPFAAHHKRIRRESPSPLQKIARALRNNPTFWQALMNFAEEARPARVPRILLHPPRRPLLHRANRRIKSRALPTKPPATPRAHSVPNCSNPQRSRKSSSSAPAPPRIESHPARRHPKSARAGGGSRLVLVLPVRRLRLPTPNPPLSTSDRDSLRF